jgi:hypothetical protein
MNRFIYFYTLFKFARMKRIILILLFLTVTFVSFSQSVIENVLFDYYNNSSDNDFVNYFSGGLGLSQITTNGITGGCLVTPNTVSWGNDNAIYCSKYIAADSSTTNTRISFKYDTTQINSSNFDRAVSIFLRPSADFNHYVIASVNYNKRLQIITYSWANNPPLLNLLHDHWYELLLNISFTADSPSYQVNASAMVNDLGITGQLPPIPVGFSNGSFNDSLLYGDNAVEVSITGSLWGGAKYLDNFHFEGIKSPDSCSFTTQAFPMQFEPFEINIRNNSFDVLNNISTFKLEVYSVSGQWFLSEICSRNTASYDISPLPAGIYFLRISSDTYTESRKIILLK